MISTLVYNKSPKELAGMKSIMRDLAAILTEENWNYFFTSSADEAYDEAMKRDLIDMSCYDITTGEIDRVAEIRKRHQALKLLLISDNTISPMEYVRPDILASALLLRPLSTEMVENTLREMINDYLSNNKAEEESFIVDTRDGQTRIPYSNILYFEAAQKRIHIRLKNESFVCMGTLDALEESLPDYFVRCHRSFVVNRQYISNIRFADSIIFLAYDMNIPLSRSYKDRFKSQKREG